MKLVKYSSNYFSILQSWVTDPDLLFQFAGSDFRFPLTTGQLINYEAGHPDRSFYMCLDEGKPIAFGEIIPQQNGVPRLGRLLVGGENSRGKGLGVRFIKLLIEECKRLYHPPSVELYVLDDNRQAIRCYQKCGFDFLPGQSIKILYNGRDFAGLKMAIGLTYVEPD